MGRHADPGQPNALDPAPDADTPAAPAPSPSGAELRAEDTVRTVRRIERWILAPTCLLVALALLVNQPGPSPALAFLRLVAPLPVWAVLFGAATVLLAVRLSEPGHVAAFLGWVAITLGATSGLVLGSTTSPTASLIFAGMSASATALHLTGFAFRRVERARGRTG